MAAIKTAPPTSVYSMASSCLLGAGGGSDRRRVLAPRTSEEEALFIARKYLENKTILEAKLANAVNGGRFMRQSMLDVVAAELSAKFNVANRNRKYVEQKLRDMKKEARKYLNMAKTTKVLETGEVVRSIPRNPPEPIRVMMEAMAEDHLSFSGADASWTELDFSDTTSKADGSEPEDEECSKSPGALNSESVASTSSSSSIDMGHGSGGGGGGGGVLGIDTILGAYFGQPMLAAMAGMMQSGASVGASLGATDKPSPYGTSPDDHDDTASAHAPLVGGGVSGRGGVPVRRRPVQVRRALRRRALQQRRSRVGESQMLAAESLRRLCDSLMETLPQVAKSFEEACKLQGEYFRLQISLVGFASQMQQMNGFHPLK